VVVAAVFEGEEYPKIGRLLADGAEGLAIDMGGDPAAFLRYAGSGAVSAFRAVHGGPFLPLVAGMSSVFEVYGNVPCHLGGQDILHHVFWIKPVEPLYVAHHAVG